MTTVALELAEKQLSHLIDEVSSGERVLITRNEEPVAELVAVARTKGKPVFGWAKGKIWMSDDFDDPIPGFEEYTG